MTRRIVLQLADDTDDRCGSCEYFQKHPHNPGGRHAWCDVFGILENFQRSYSCRSAELRPETVEAIRTALETFVLVSETDDEKPALADFERLFGGVE